MGVAAAAEESETLNRLQYPTSRRKAHMVRSKSTVVVEFGQRTAHKRKSIPRLFKYLAP
jgi:hypothetical protein